MEMEKDDLRAIEARKALAKEHGVNEAELDWVGPMAAPHIAEEAALICYNIMRIGHPKDKSTVAYKSGWPNK